MTKRALVSADQKFYWSGGKRVLKSADWQRYWSGTGWTEYPYQARIYTDRQAKEIHASVVANGWKWKYLDLEPIDWDCVGDCVGVVYIAVCWVIAPIVVVIGLLLK